MEAANGVIVVGVVLAVGIVDVLVVTAGVWVSSG